MFHTPVLESRNRHHVIHLERVPDSRVAFHPFQRMAHLPGNLRDTGIDFRRIRFPVINPDPTVIHKSFRVREPPYRECK